MQGALLTDNNLLVQKLRAVCLALPSVARCLFVDVPESEPTWSQPLVNMKPP